MGNTFGKLFQVTTWGESHGPAIGVVVDGCPAGLKLAKEDIQKHLDRRRPGNSDYVSSRQEEDNIVILSGVEGGKTIGSPISLVVYNQDSRKQEYEGTKNLFRPSHADYSYLLKYGILQQSGGGRSSARETIGRVAAGAIAQKILLECFNIEITAYVERIGNISVDASIVLNPASKKCIATSPVFCPDLEVSQKICQAITVAKEEGDSLGGTVFCHIQNTPGGWGEPVFDKLEADLAKACLSIPASKSFEIGSGLSGTYMKGSQHNDLFVVNNQKISTLTNHSGGIQGGISNGEPIYFRVGFKPPASISKTQKTVSVTKEATLTSISGRHDPCVVPRAVPIVEAMAGLVLVDQCLRQQAYSGLLKHC